MLPRKLQVSKDLRQSVMLEIAGAMFSNVELLHKCARIHLARAAKRIAFITAHCALCRFGLNFFKQATAAMRGHAFPIGECILLEGSKSNTIYVVRLALAGYQQTLWLRIHVSRARLLLAKSSC